jgi:hypothetical protein
MNESLVKKLRVIAPLNRGVAEIYIEKAADEIERLEGLLAEASKDAERYRWLREFGARAAIYVPANKGTEMELAQLEKLDEAIDAAIKEQSNG